MKLAVLGLVTAAIGIWVGSWGLIGIGAYWVALGPVLRHHRNQLLAAAPSGDGSRPAADRRALARGAVIWGIIGVPSLVVGLLQIGFAAEDAEWRWLPIAVGALATSLGGLAVVLYGVGSAVRGQPGGDGPADVPATIWIRAVRETGTFINERPRLEFELQVEPDDATAMQPYDVTKKATVPFTAIGALRVGDGFRARVAGTEDPTAMEILWSEPVSSVEGRGAPAVNDVTARLKDLERLRDTGSITAQEHDEQRRRILDSL